MFKRFLSESFRSKKNRPLSFIINWLGLTLGFAAVIVMYLFIVGQLRHDRGFTREMDDVWRCEIDPDGLGAVCPGPTAAFMAAMPEVMAATRVQGSPTMTVSAFGNDRGERFSMRVQLADSSYFSVFPHPFLSGDQRTALADSSCAVLTRSAAQRLFGTIDAVGRQIQIENSMTAGVTAVIEDVPENSSYVPEVICNLRLVSSAANLDRWNNWGNDAYFRVHSGVDMVGFETRYVKAIYDRLFRDEWGSKTSLDSIPADKLPQLRSFNDSYFAADTVSTAPNKMDPKTLVVLAIVASLILVIAVINYVNIYTARSTEVIRSMGIKSIMGANRGSLISFVIGDSVLITFLSALSAFGIALILRPFYTPLFGGVVSFDLSWDMLLVLFVGLPVLCGALCGIFPALALTRMKPLDAMANRSSGGRQMSVVRNVLIVFQFVISIGLVASTLIINKQMRYVASLDMGYDRERVVYVGGGNFFSGKFDSFRQQLLANPGIKDATRVSTNPMAIGSMMTVTLDDSNRDLDYTPMLLWGDEHTLHVFGIPMVEGDSISSENINNLQWGQFMVNEAFAKVIRERVPGTNFPDKRYIGVFKDFQHAPVTQTITPLIIGAIRMNGDGGDAYIKLGAGDPAAALKHIEKTFRQMFPDELYSYEFMDAQFDMMYKNEQLFQTRLITFSVLAVVIGCLGLFALVGYSVERRRKEIAIRKVHGSMVVEVVGMLCVSFVKWLGISFVIAVPLVWWLMSGWLESYVYRTEMSWWIFALAGLVTLVIALLTVLGQSYKAAVENPATAVKSE